MTTTTRRTIESPKYQGVDEQIAYTLTTTPWGSSPTSVSVAIKQLPALTDTSATNLSGSAGVAGDVITMPLVKSLVADTQYRLEIKFTCSGNIFEAWSYINGEV